jgi:hypothetical protein
VTEHLLLIRHASAWANQKKRALDPQLLETALDLRAFHDDAPATHWPLGSIEHLMLRRWPAHGPEAPDTAALAETLGTYVQFLRATGRMASGSGDPKALAKEARRAAPKMADACAELGAHSQSKVLMDFGREIGIDLEGASSIDDVQGQLDRLMGEWNALPEDERKRRMPLTSTEPGVHSRTISFGGSDEDEDDEPVRQGDPARSADQARGSPFVQACLRLAEWLTPSKKVTEIGVLRLAPAEAAYRELELWRWQEEAEAIDFDSASARAMASGPGKEPLFWWKSAADVDALERVWSSALEAGLVDLYATIAKPSGVLPESDDEWIALACAAFIGLWESAEDFRASRAPLLALLGNGLVGDGSVSWDELVGLWASHPDNIWARLPDREGLPAKDAQGWSERHLRRSMHWFSDTGIWTREGDDLVLTDLGRDFGALLFNLLDQGDLEL